MDINIGNPGLSAFALMEKLNKVRVAGTDGESEAAQAIYDEISSMGLAPRMEPFEIDGYEIETATLEINKPYVRSFPVTGYGLSGNTPDGGLRAEFLYAEDCNDIALAHARGKIILLNAHVKPFQYHKMVKAGVAGFITISGLAVDERDKTDLETRMLRTDRHLKDGDNVMSKIPGVTIRAMDALEMLRDGDPEEATITLKQTEKKLTSRNIIVEIEGGDRADEWITIGAHYDSVPFSPGMYDNASGSAIICEACRHFALNKPRRSLRFIWFGAEERGLLGSLHHITANPDEIKATKLMINVDLAGQVIGTHQFVITAQERVGDFLRFMAQEAGFGATVKQDIYSSDSTAYADAGVPSFSFLRGGTVGHSRQDIIGLCSPAAMDKSTRFMLHFTSRIVNSAVLPVPPEVPEDLKDKLAIYFGRKPPEDIQ